MRIRNKCERETVEAKKLGNQIERERERERQTESVQELKSLQVISQIV